MSNTLCIKGLSNNCNQDKLKSALECFGPCTIDIQGNVAQVTYLSEESVLKAVPSLNRTNLLGANSNDVEITSLNPKVNKWSYYSAPSINENFKYTDMQGKSSPNFGGFSSVRGF